MRPGDIPHPLATASWEIEQERNLAYVAVTRSRDLLVFIGPIPAIYRPQESGVMVEMSGEVKGMDGRGKDSRW